MYTFVLFFHYKKLTRFSIYSMNALMLGLLCLYQYIYDFLYESVMSAMYLYSCGVR